MEQNLFQFFFLMMITMNHTAVQNSRPTHSLVLSAGMLPGHQTTRSKRMKHAYGTLIKICTTAYVGDR